MGSSSCVADHRGDQSVEDSHLKCRWGHSDEFSFIAIVVGALFPFLLVGAVPANAVNMESKTHMFVGCLSGRKNCFNGVDPFNVVSEWGPIVAQDDGQRCVIFLFCFIQSFMLPLFMDPCPCHPVLRGLYQLGIFNLLASRE